MTRKGTGDHAAAELQPPPQIDVQQQPRASRIVCTIVQVVLSSFYVSDFTHLPDHEVQEQEQSLHHHRHESFELANNSPRVLERRSQIGAVLHNAAYAVLHILQNGATIVAELLKSAAADSACCSICAHICCPACRGNTTGRCSRKTMRSAGLETRTCWETLPRWLTSSMSKASAAAACSMKPCTAAIISQDGNKAHKQIAAPQGTH